MREREQWPGEGFRPPDGVESEVRLLHHRRRWAWVTFASLVALVVYVIIGVEFFQDLTGALEAVSVVPLFVFLALVPLGLIIVIVETVRLHRHEAFLATAQGRVYRYPPWHWLSWLLSVAWVVSLVSPPLAYLPNEVDAVAYLAGAGDQVTFVPTSYHRVYTRRGSYQVTDGVVEPGGERLTWPTKVPLHRSFAVRRPVWQSPGAFIISGTGDALVRVAMALFFNLLGALAIFVFVWSSRHRVIRRREWMTAHARAPG